MDILFIIVVFILLWVIIEVLSIVFKITGLELSKARFQVISLITHTGFTTRESELILQHPTRRRIASILMFISYIAQISLISVFLHLLSEDRQRLELIAVILVLVVVFIFVSTKNRFVSTRFNNFLEKALKRQVMKNIEKIPIEQMLKLSKDYGIYELIIDDKSSLCNKSLNETKLTEDYIQVLQVDHGNNITDFPQPTLVLQAGDKLIVYGRTKSIFRRIMGKKNSNLDKNDHRIDS